MKQPTDVAHAKISTSSIESKLNWVGMENIKLQLSLGSLPQTLGSLSAYVSLTQADQRGIHMSRVYELAANQFGKTLDSTETQNLLKSMISSQKGLSDSARIEYRTHALLERKALISAKTGYKDYPIRLKASMTPKGLRVVVSIQIEYSSTCPCSAALSREEIANQFEQFFSKGNLSLEEARNFLLREDTWPAWPHSQRSRATGHFRIDPKGEFPDFIKFIDKMENAL